MTWMHLKTCLEPNFYALRIDNFFPKKLRSVLRKAFIFGSFFFFLASFSSLPFSFISADGLFFLFVFFYLILFFLECFYRSMKNDGIKSRAKNDTTINGLCKEYALSELAFELDEIDATRCLFETQIGASIFERAGIEKDHVLQFINSGRTPIIASTLVIESDVLDLLSLVSAIYESDKSLQNFLSAHSINKSEFLGATKMMGDIFEKRRREDRFWSRENLGSIPSIGTSWGYGISSDLGKFGRNFESIVNIASVDIENGFRQKEIMSLEAVLDRKAEANIVLVDDDESVARDIVTRLVKRIKLGVTLPSIEYKNIVELDWNALVSSFKDKSDLQREILQILNQAKSAGNIIIYIRDFSGFVVSGNNSGVNIPSLLSPFLSSANLEIIAHASKSDFHFFIETNPTILERFERIIPDEIGSEASLPAVIEKALLLETEYKIIFSFSSLQKIIESADRYISLGEMPAKAFDMMLEITPWAVNKNINFLKEQDVATFVSEKTGILVGSIKDDEAEKINNLEQVLHNRIVGQNVAISALSSAMRRARSGLNKPNRPIASFLFLGPTGSGKTETTKALSEIFFGEEKMLRFDMSEYNDLDAIPRLLGSFGENRSGILASKIRDNPYGVLLLDEFEKASKDVLDLFLQILDEGVFTDALGKKVNCRNLIIVATSNAGSSLIWESMRQNRDLAKEQPNIIDGIIKEKIFKPELINRFDGVVLFHPLQNDELREVAKLELKKLAKRLEEKEMEFVVTDDLIDFLVQEGSSDQFGARSINRAIQNKVEDLIARKIVSGELKPGSKIELNKNDFL